MKGAVAMRTVAVILALASSALLFAQEDPKIQDAIRGLGAESFEDREKATAELKRIGAPAQEALKKAAAESSDPEVRERAKRILESITKPQAPRKPAAPQTFTVQGARVSIRRSGDSTVYSLNPQEGDALQIHRNGEGMLKLVYPDGEGGKADAEAETVEKFVEIHKELAAKYGITKDGIDYAGTRLSFSKVSTVPAFPQVELPPMPDFREFDDLFGRREDLRKAFEDLNRHWRAAPRPALEFGTFGYQVVRGAQLSPVPDVLRSQLSIPEGQGVVVDSVREGSTAAAAGLKRHDVILEIDGEKVTGPADVRARLKRDSALKALRGGKEQSIQPAPPPRRDF